jgi:DNA-binding helix-hairpin-helix protein with protein kinase domain
MNLRRVSDGSRVRLGPELGRGGEGAVYAVIGEARVAKIYFKAPSPAKVEKLRVMTRVATPGLLRVAAWPTDLLEDEKRRVRGFLMPRVDAREDVHQLYSPKSRRRAFSGADFRFIVRAAANVARAFASMHEAGHVIGDVNHGNALIGKDATVMLIDCDSFQVRDVAGRIFTCDVGVPLFTAPELQNMGFRGLKRAIRHDSFGLAVLIFHLLFQGRHPFAGLYQGGEMPIERAIAESRFAYGAMNAQRGMTSPPATLPLDTFGARIALLFESAFAPPGETWRPQAVEWVLALEALERELVECSVATLHFHPRGQDCCWCAIEKKSGVRLFDVTAGIELGVASLQSLWSRIRAVRKPAQDPMYQVEFPWPRIPKAPRWANWRPTPKLPKVSDWRIYLTIGSVYLLFMIASNAEASVFLPTLLVVAAGLGLLHGWRWMRLKALRALADFRKHELARAEREWQRLVKVWNEQCSSARFNHEVQRLQLAKQELMSWDTARRTELRRLRREHESRARELHLRQFSIEPSQFRLNPTDVSALASFGFETAADVIHRMPELLGVLEKSKALDLQTWARGLSGKFQFDRRAPPDPRLVAEVEQRLAGRQRELQAALLAGPDVLERMRQEIETSRERMQPAMEVAMKELRATRAAAKSISES